MRQIGILVLRFLIKSPGVNLVKKLELIFGVVDARELAQHFKKLFNKRPLKMRPSDFPPNLFGVVIHNQLTKLNKFRVLIN